jgi:hypothetical protein
MVTTPVAVSTNHAVVDVMRITVGVVIYSVYREDLYTPLVRTLLDLMHANSICFLGSTKQFTTPVFFQLLTRHGLVYKKIPHGSMSSSDENIGIFVIHRRRRSSLR